MVRATAADTHMTHAPKTAATECEAVDACRLHIFAVMCDSSSKAGYWMESGRI